MEKEQQLKVSLVLHAYRVRRRCLYLALPIPELAALLQGPDRSVSKFALPREQVQVEVTHLLACLCIMDAVELDVLVPRMGRLDLCEPQTCNTRSSSSLQR